MNPNGWQAGTLVESPARPEWGPGKIVRVVPERVYVIWRDRPGREAKAIVTSALRLAADQHDPVLDHLPPLIEKDGKLMLPTERITFQQAVNTFLARFPQGFQDPAYISDPETGERDYKWAAHEYYVQHLGGGRFRELLRNDLPGLVQEVERCISKVNLLYVTEAAALRDALRDENAARSFFTRLADLLEAEKVTEQVFAPYAEAVCDLPATRGRVATWPVATILLFLAQPDRHLLLKPDVTSRAADSLGFQLNYRPEPNWLTYRCLLQMAEIYRDKLAPWKPVDLIDVQSFFWVACQG
ncbi:MAG: hypothetical protein U0Z53_31470 [Blastocatellia bacterium]